VLVALALAGLVVAGAWLWQASRAWWEWRQAEAALGRHDLAAAAAHLERYLERRPHDAAAWFLAGRTARRRGRYPEAERCLERCQQLGGVTDATRLEWDLLRVQQGDLRDIDARLRRTIGPDHPDALFVLEALAQGYFRCERLPDALEACELGLQREPGQLWPWLWRGRVFERLRYFDRALADYRRATEIAPDDPEARLAMGWLLLRQRQPGPAAEQFEYLLARSADDEAVLLGVAACRIEQSRSAEAVPLLERVLAKYPSSPSGLLLRGKAALEQDDPAGAEGWLREAVRLAPDDAEALHLLVQCLRARSQDAEADPLAERLEQLRKDLHRLDEVVRAVARQPDDAGPRHEAGVIALRVGRPDEGLRWLHEALRAQGDHGPTHAALADYYRRQGDQAAADFHRRQAGNP
jgi:tetratricopeptide (TPR) repeat protein